MLYTAIREDVRTGKELSLASRKLAGLNAKLEELDRAKSEFISIASHQLRTPLTSVKGFTSLILDNTIGKISPGPKKEVEKIFVNNEKLCLLVEDMLNASRLEAGRLEYELEEADIVSVIESTMSVISLYAKSKKIKLSLKVAKEKLIAIVDQRKLSEIISNLIDNAIKYTPKGSVTVTIEKFIKDQRVGKINGSGTANRDWARISVKDTGLGMTEKQLAGIFDKFKGGSGDTNSHTSSGRQEATSLSSPEETDTIPSREARPYRTGTFGRGSSPKGEGGVSSPNGNGNGLTVGTGLGVYISRQMAHAMGGKLYAESRGKGHGSTFILELPLVKK